MEKFEHIAYMFNERTIGKKYENYVVNAIYTKINNPELIPVTQQCVRNVKDKRHYYLLDLYFPQLNYGIEVDEGQHESSEHQRKDKERAENILSAIECEEGRIKIYQSDGKTIRSFDDITEQIDREVEKIKAMMESKNIIWKDNEEQKEEILKHGYFDINDDVVYKNFTEIYFLIKERELKNNQEAGRPLNNDYYLWVPTLSIMRDNGEIVKANGNWENYINEDHTEIRERDVQNKKELKAGYGSVCYSHLTDSKKLDYTCSRVVFMKMKDRFNKVVIKFIGVFKFTHAEIQKNGSCDRYYKRIDTRVSIADLRNDFQKEVQEKNTKKDTDFIRAQIVTGGKAIQYWAKFRNYLTERNIKFPEDSTSSVGTGSNNVIFNETSPSVFFTFTFKSRNKTIGCELYTQNKDKNLFFFLQEHQIEIEKEIGFKLDWQELKGKKATRIEKKLPVDTNDTTHYSEYFDWMIDKGQKFLKVFPKYITMFKK